jgi:hypothetical protein
VWYRLDQEQGLGSAPSSIQNGHDSCATIPVSGGDDYA